MKVMMVGQPRDLLRGAGSEEGSVSIVLRALADLLASQVDLDVIAARGPGQPEAETTAAGWQLHRLPAPGRTLQKAADLTQGVSGVGLPMIARDIYYRSYAKAVARKAAALSPDIVHLMTFPQFATPIRAAAPGARLVLHLHDEALARLPRDLVAERLRPFSAVVACSNWVARTLVARHGELAGRMTAIGNGADVERLSASSQVHDAFPKLLYLGRVSPEKGSHVLLDAFLRLAPRRPDLKLVFAGPVGLMPSSYIRLIEGDAPMQSVHRFYGTTLPGRIVRQILRGRSSFAEALKAMVPPELADRILWLGTVPHDAIASLMGDRTILVQPSLWHEAYGLPVAEAMACGVPTIGTRRGAIPDILEDGRAGRLVAAGDAAALADAAEGLLADPEGARRLGLAGRAAIAGTASWERVAERLLEVWREVELS